MVVMIPSFGGGDGCYCVGDYMAVKVSFVMIMTMVMMVMVVVGMTLVLMKIFGMVLSPILINVTGHCGVPTLHWYADPPITMQVCPSHIPLIHVY